MRTSAKAVQMLVMAEFVEDTGGSGDTGQRTGEEAAYRRRCDDDREYRQMTETCKQLQWSAALRQLGLVSCKADALGIGCERCV